MESATSSPLPVELWAEILNWLLFDPDLVNPNPFYPNCNVHFALPRWNDTSRFHEVQKQREILRLVCRAWKALADSSRYRFWEGNDLPNLDMPWQLASRVQITYQRPNHSCDCVKWCHCRGLRDPNNLKQTYGEILLHHLSALDSAERLPICILQMPLPLSSLYVDQSNLERLQHLLANVQALRVTTHYLKGMAKFIMGVFPNLVYLDIYITDPTSDDNDDQCLDLPLVETLVVHGSGGAFDHYIDRWIFPRLLHLELCVDDVFVDRELRSILRFLSECGQHLQTLRLIRDYTLVTLPANFWENVPELIYLGMTRISGIPSEPPPRGHPIKRIGNLEQRAGEAAHDPLITFLDTCTDLEAVADIHDWEYIPARDAETDGRYASHQHQDEPCRICVGILQDYCSSRGWRYEDYRGRTLGEYRAQNSSRKAIDDTLN